MAGDQTDASSDDSDQRTRQDMDPTTRAMLEQQKTETFWEASVDREAVSGSTYMGDYHVHYSTIDEEHIEFLIMITSVVVTFVLAINTLLSTYTRLIVPASIQISGTIAVVTVTDYFRGPNSDSEESQTESDS